MSRKEILEPGLPDFSWSMIPKPEKCTKSTQMYIPNGHKISQMSVKYSNGHKIHISTFPNLRQSKICPEWDFWFEKQPSGNPALL
jgi:hypothetical protein